VARALHTRSARASGPFNVINCSSLSQELAESELFGHEKGAFTGADRLHKGAFEESNAGTLFLDEVAELPVGVQSKLLRALEASEIRRVGASNPIKVDVRVVVATNKDLRAEVKRGAFREDLYWRFAMHLALPPLRDRRGDVGLLIHYFLRQLCPPKTKATLSKEAEQQLLAYSWPGNVRELRNTVHRALFVRAGERIEAEDVSFDPKPEAVQSVGAEDIPDPHVDDVNRVFIIGKQLEEIIDEVVTKTCRRLGPPPKVAQALGVARATVYRRLERLGFEASDFASEPEDAAK